MGLTRPLTRALSRSLTRGLGRSVGVVYDPDVQDYFDRAEALGGSFAIDATYTEPLVKSAFNSFVLALKADGTWDKLDEIFPGCGVTFAGITAKLKHSGNDEVTLANFVSGDYTPAGATLGLKGNGLSKQVNSNWNPSDTITPPSAHHSLFTTVEATGASDNSLEGSNDGSNILSGFFPFNDGTVYSDMFSVAGGRISVASATEGFIICNATASAHRLIYNGSAIQTGASPTGNAPTTPYYFFSRGGAGYSDARRSVRTMGQGLTTGQETTLNNATQALMVSLGYIP